MPTRRFEVTRAARFAVARTTASLLAGILVCACAAAAEWRWQDVPRVVAISDVHGAHDAFVRTLRASELIDNGGAWSGDGTHLVITGDLLDRGPDSRDVMDLLMRLEREAIEAGGRVHVLLGNHEVMNLVGDLRYVSPREYAAFAADEDAGERNRWFLRFLERSGKDVGDDGVRVQFDRQYPPGFFAHRRAFRADGSYGEWLLGKPLIVVINGTAFVHGGLSPLVAELGLDGINGTMANELRAYVEAIATLTDYGALHPGDSFYNHGKILAALPPDADRPADADAAIATIERLDDAGIHGSNSPLWYRGTAGCSAIVETARLAPAFEKLGAERVVIGHTPTVTRGVLSRLDGRVIEIDTGMLHAYYEGSGHALVIDQSGLSVIDEQGKRPALAADPRLNGSDGLGDDALEAMLQNGELTVSGERPDDALSVTIADGKHTLEAVFHPAGRRGALPELAAYRLDRLLGLQMVPVTVARAVNGDQGSVQLLRAGLVNETQRAEARAGTSAWCPLPDQWAAMYRFDTLIYKSERSAEQILYDRGNWQLILNGHENAFGTGRGRPPYLKNVEVELDDAWREELGALTDERIDAALGELLDDGRIRALKRRRDALLAP